MLYSREKRSRNLRGEREHVSPRQALLECFESRLPRLLEADGGTLRNPTMLRGFNHGLRLSGAGFVERFTSTTALASLRGIRKDVSRVPWI